MPTPLLLEFPPDEYKARVKKLTDNMHEQAWMRSFLPPEIIHATFADPDYCLDQ